MSLLLTVLLLGLNFLISWSNASYVGKFWSESKAVGGSFRAYIICGYAMAIAGFTMVYAYILLLITPAFLQTQNVDPELIARFVQLGADLTYLLVGGVVVCSGVRIWFQSLRNAWERKSVSHFATAGWNTFAQVHNTINYARNAPSAFGRIVDALFGGSKTRSRSSKKNDAMVIYLAIALVILAVLGGFFTADAIMKRADANYDMFRDYERRYMGGQQPATERRSYW